MPANLDPQNLLTPAAIGGGASLLQQTPAVDHTGYPRYGLAMRFRVEVDQLAKLGSWLSCKGLKVEFKSTVMTEGSNYTSSTLLPERLEYGRITLERAIRQPDSTQVQNWLRDVQAKWIVPGQSCYSQMAKITLLDYDQSTLMSWTLRDVVPVSWSCSPLAAKSGDVAVETLELQHGGFL
jgi:phage tail-like protein